MTWVETLVHKESQRMADMQVEAEKQFRLIAAEHEKWAKAYNQILELQRKLG